jgi:glucoamylase
MPLVWAHAEYLKLRRSLRDGQIFDQPPQTVQRYVVKKTTSLLIAWRFNNKVRAMPAGRILRIETLSPALVHWSVDDWVTVHDTPTRDTTLGVHVADLDTMMLCPGDRVSFTFYWPDEGRWEGTDFFVSVE